MDNIINKCLKSYLCGKKYYTIDKDKSYKYFFQSLKIIKNLKKNNDIPLKFTEILDETEKECYNLLPINLFDVIENGNLYILNKLNNINFKIYNENGLTPLHYAIDYGDLSFLKLALKLGCSVDETTLSGHTLLEYACLSKDPNILSFLLANGADMKKHIEFRKNNKYINNGNSLDIILIFKKILDVDIIDSTNNLDWIFKYINPNMILDIKNIDKTDILFKYLILKLNNFLNNIPSESKETYLNILREELEYDLSNNLNCPNNKIDLICYYLIPFINYEFDLKLLWLNKYFSTN
jgi:ankyrin repeat protein